MLSFPTSRLLEVAFRLLARLRRGRALHPRGTTFAARLVMAGEGPLPTGESACVVRLSKGGGTPGRLPDALGIGLRLEVGGRPVDVLATSCLGTSGWRRLVPWPTTSWGRSGFSSLMPLACGQRRLQVLLECADRRLTSADVAALGRRLPVRFVVRVADRRQDVQRGELVVEGPQVPPVDLDAVRNAPPGWRLVPGWLAAARVAAYAGSRQGRPDTARSLHPVE